MKIVTCKCRQCKFVLRTKGGSKTMKLATRAARRTAKQAVALGKDFSTKRWVAHLA